MGQHGWWLDDPNGQFAVIPWRMHLEFRNDGRFIERFVERNLIHDAVEGKWTLLTDGRNAARVRIEVQGHQPADVQVRRSGEILSLSLPTFTDLRIDSNLSLLPVYGSPTTVQWKEFGDQVLQWVKANGRAPDTTSLEGTTADYLDQSRRENAWTALTFEGDLLKSQTTTDVVMAYNKLSVLPYSNGQARRLNLPKGSVIRSPLKPCAVDLAPQVRVESFTLDNKNVYDPASALTGKLVMRTLQDVPDQDYMLVMSSVHGMNWVYLPGAAGPDAETFPFKLNAIAPAGREQYVNPDPLPVVFVVVCEEKREMPADRLGPRICSEPIAMLMDIAAREDRSPATPATTGRGP